MGTTKTALTTSDGVALQTIVLIEGCEHALTDGDTTAAATALAATEWTSVLGGLQVMGSIKQSLRPWEPGLEPSRITIAVQPDDDDTFGRLVFGRGAGTETRLDATIDANETAIEVVNADPFAASGSIHIGPEHITYSARDTGTDTFTVSARGKYAPFKANTETQQRFGRNHRIPNIGHGLVLKPKVTSVQREWVGRWIGVWVHRRLGTVLDTKAEAQLIWAGRVANVYDQSSGMTYLECEDWRSALRDCVLLNDQWSAKVKEGIYLRPGWRFEADDSKAGVEKVANDLVVTSGTPGTNQIAAGIYTASELASALNSWFAAEKAAGRLNMTWNWSPQVQTDAGPRSQFSFTDGDLNNSNWVRFRAPEAVRVFMGFQPEADLFDAFHDWIGSADSDPYLSPEEPYRIYAASQSGGGNILELEDVKGTWFDNQAGLGLSSTLDGEYAALQVNEGPMAIFRKVDDDTVQYFAAQEELDAIAGTAWNDPNATGLRAVRVSQSGELRLRQVVILTDSGWKMLTKLLASTGANGYNHATYDVLPAQLGAAIPWQLLGDGWLSSAQAATDAFSAMRLVIEKPTKLTDLIGGDLVARTVAFRWKDQGIQLSGWSTPSVGTSVYALTEANKRAPAKQKDDHRTATRLTTDFLRNSVKLEYNRLLSGGYQASLQIIDPSSVDEHGGRPVTIQLRNSYGTSDDLGEIADALATALSWWIRPLSTLKRTIDLNAFESIAPGDVVTISDDFARDPETGARGLTTKPALVLATDYDLGGWESDTGQARPMRGEAELLILPIDNVSTYCPAADVDHTQPNGGYTAASKTLTCVAHAYSEASEDADATHFPAGSEILIHEVDPDDPATGGAITATVDSQTGNTIVLTTDISGSWDANKRWRIIPSSYSNATATHRALVYQASDTTGVVASGVVYTWGASATQGSDGTEDTGTEQAVLCHAHQYTQWDGAPALDVGQERDACQMLNGLQNYRTAPMGSDMSRSVSGFVSASNVRGILRQVPIFVGIGDLLGGDRRLYVTPFFRSASGAAVKLYATLCSAPPIGTSNQITDTDAPEYVLVGGGTTLEWSTSSTTWGEGSTQDVSISTVNRSIGLGFLVLEGESNLELRGVSWYVGPYIEP